MKCAVLCNGPSRVDYQPSSDYEYIIGCNIPWTKVDATVILDINVVKYWHKNPGAINVPAYFSEHAWRETRFADRDFFKPYFIDLVKPLPEYDSSGHVACSLVINKGYKQIDIYGCDSWFESTTESYTHEYIDSRATRDSKKHVIGWRNRWQNIMNGHPDVQINFIRKEK